MLARLAERGYDEVEEVTVAREDVHFRLPREVAAGAAMTSVEIPYSVAAALPTLSVFDITNDVSRAVARAGRERGIAYVAPAADRASIRVNERESGFFRDFEELLSRLVPLDMRERERLILRCSARAPSRSRSRPAGCASASGSASCSSASATRRGRLHAHARRLSPARRASDSARHC